MQGTWFRAAICLLALSTATVAPKAWSFDDEEETYSYDVIVNSLNRQVESQDQATSRARNTNVTSNDPFENVWMHAGAGLVNVTQTIDYDDGSKAYLNQKGVQASLGIDLFSPNWMAEGTVRSFDDNEDTSTQVSLKEFELKIFFKDRMAKNLGYRVGGGLSGRYMTITRQGLETLDYSTPSSVGTVGIDLFLTDRFSLGAEISARSAMIAETLDRSSLDGTLRLDAHF